MRVKKFKIFKYAISFKRPVTVKGNRLQKREGFIIQLINESGYTGFGEIAPLPGFSRESLANTLIQLKALRVLALNNVFTDAPENALKEVSAWLRKFKLFPSVRFGIETAFLNVYADEHKVPLAALLNRRYAKKIAVNALLDGAKAQIVAEARKKAAAGWRSLKIKVGREPLIDEAQKIKSLQDIADNRFKLRIDINCAFSHAQAVVFGLLIGRKAVDYIEEPLEEVSQLPLFISATGLPVALDENISCALKFKGVKAVVLKPMLIGGIEQTLKLIRLAKNHKLKAVISSSFESGIGLTALANLAACAGKTHAGLDTRKFFKRDLLQKDFLRKNGTCAIKNFAHQRINMNMLRKIHG